MGTAVAKLSQRQVQPPAIRIVQLEASRCDWSRSSTKENELRNVSTAVSEVWEQGCGETHLIGLDYGWRGCDQKFAALVIVSAKAYHRYGGGVRDDSNYALERICQSGKQIDQKLRELRKSSQIDRSRINSGETAAVQLR